MLIGIFSILALLAFGSWLSWWVGRMQDQIDDRHHNATEE